MTKKKTITKDPILDNFYFEGNTFFYRSLPEIKQFSACTNRKNQEIIGLIKKLQLTTNRDISANTILSEEELLELCMHYHFELQKKEIISYQNLLLETRKINPKDKLIHRGPIVTIMGHIDHGKTTLLDYIKKSNIAEKEHGKITQTVNAYQINFHQQTITFLDTPGHHFFAEMRSRSADLTDLVILVVSAKEGVKQQTKEIYNYLSFIQIPIIVFLNKIDEKTANIEKTINELEEMGLIISDHGGEITCIQGSGLTGKGVNELLEHILLMAEHLPGLEASYDHRGSGIIIDNYFDKQVGNVCNLILKDGTLNLRD
jgi:translation initiation factor IF-2